MDCWSHGSEGRRLVLSDEMISSSTGDAIAWNGNRPAYWHMKNPSSCEDGALISASTTAESEGFIELSGDGVDGTIIPSSSSGGMINQIFNCVEDPDVSGASSSCGDSSSTPDSSFIDLKLGRLTDWRDNVNGKSPSSVASPAAAAPKKRSRFWSSKGQAPRCQVHGCSTDLSSSKDYHKKHKVCENHSKAARVIVNGIEQRFCQQCSRFHLLVEFDNGKRSCRKRLAGHNERRRRPHLANHSGRAAHLLSSQHGSTYFGASLSLGASFVSPDVFLITDAQGVESHNRDWFKNTKAEVDFNTQPQMSSLSCHMLSKQFYPPYGAEKPLPSLQSIDAEPDGLCFISGNRNMQERWHYSGSKSAFQNGSSEFTSFDTPSSIDSMNEVANSVCALSLLSCPWHNSSPHPSQITAAPPLTFQARHAHHDFSPFSEKHFNASSQPSTSTSLSPFCSPQVEDDDLGAILVSNVSNVFAFATQVGSDIQDSSLFNYKDTVFSHEKGQTIDLLPLSSQHRKGEIQRPTTG